MSEEEMLLVQLRKWMNKYGLDNASLCQRAINLTIPAGEKVVAEIVNTRNRALHFTGVGFTIPDHGFVRYSDVRWVKWMKGWQLRPPRRDEFDHLHLFLNDGTSVTLKDLDQAVFPLRRFFEWMIAKRKQAT